MRRIATIFLVLFVAACQHAVHSKNIASPIPNERGEAHFEELSPGVWSHATYMEMERWGAVLSHGLIVLRGDHSILIDSGWTDTQTDDIMDWAEQDLGKPIAKAVFTHGHQDKMGGVGAVRARGIPTFAHPIANSNAPWHGLTPAETDLPFNDPGDSIEIEGLDVFFPGAAHAAGNIVIYEPDSGLLFGGCMIRPL